MSDRKTDRERQRKTKRQRDKQDFSLQTDEELKHMHKRDQDHGKEQKILMEWYSNQLNIKVLAKAFFPAFNPTLQETIIINEKIF